MATPHACGSQRAHCLWLSTCKAPKASFDYGGQPLWSRITVRPPKPRTRGDGDAGAYRHEIHRSGYPAGGGFRSRARACLHRPQILPPPRPATRDRALVRPDHATPIIEGGLLPRGALHGQPDTALVGQPEVRTARRKDHTGQPRAHQRSASFTLMKCTPFGRAD